MAGEPRSVLREGIVAGLIGAAVVALWFFVYDIARGEPFRTPSLLGSFVFFGVQTPTGLDAATLADPHITAEVRIPMLTGRRSLNLSNAAAVAVYEAWRQHGFTGAV